MVARFTPILALMLGNLGNALPQIQKKPPQSAGCFTANIPCSRANWQTTPDICCPGDTSYVACSVDGKWVLEICPKYQICLNPSGYSPYCQFGD